MDIDTIHIVLLWVLAVLVNIWVLAKISLYLFLIQVTANGG